MNIKIGNKGDTKVYFLDKEATEIKGLEGVLEDLKARKIFEGNSGQVFSNVLGAGDKFLLVGLGEGEKLTTENLRRAAFAAGKELMKLKEKSVQLVVPEFSIDKISALVEGLLHSEYAFEKYLEKKKTEPSLEDVYIDVAKDQEADLLAAIDETVVLADAIFLARDLVNDPAMAMTPTVLADTAKSRLEAAGVDVKVFDKEEIEKLGMTAFLAVTQGSDQEPKFIVMDYKGDPDSDKKLALVGKGLMFDSGGYSLKPPNSMITMYSDMAGAASVIAAMEALAKSKVKKNVVAVVAACENLISGSAYKPGDIVTAMSGKTIEIFSTDAEGRLTLADALYYTVTQLKPDKVIDVATLTGACVVALGYYATGAVSNNSDFMAEVKDASLVADELVWEFPNTEDYRELNKGHFADLRNTTTSAGAIGAGLFLGEFVEDTPWVHLDIAGTSFLDSAKGYLPKGATGVPVKTLYFLAKNA